MAETPLEKLIETLCDTSDLTDAEVRAELAEQGIDLDAAMARFRPKLDDLMRARAVRLALAAVRDNPALSPLPWRDKSGAIWGANGLLADGLYADDAGHICAAVNAAPILAAEVERLQGLLAAARVAVAKVPVLYRHHHDCASLNTYLFRNPPQSPPCNCACEAVNKAQLEARRAVGLEENHG